MEFEFVYFYEPADPEKPIQKLKVVMALDFKVEPHPANALVKTYRIDIARVRVYSRMGLEVTSEFVNHKKEIEDNFRNHHQENALTEYVNNHR